MVSILTLKCGSTGLDGRRTSPPSPLLRWRLTTMLPDSNGWKHGPFRTIHVVNIVAKLALWQITHLPGIRWLIMHLMNEYNDLPIGDNGAADA